jgi:hypothetical protein
LLGHGKRGEDQRRFIGMAYNGISPYKLHGRLAKSTISEYRSSSATDSPCGNFLLKIK